MEIKKTSVPSIKQPDIQQESEVSKTKSSAQNLVPDSFETSKSSDTFWEALTEDHSGTASSEPEKKAGQITGGILIKQMTAAQLGEGFAKKELSPEQQSRVSKSDPQKENLKPSSFLQDARSRYEDRKNSGLQAPFAPRKGDASSRIPNVGKDQIIAASGQSASEQTSNAVKDANRFVDGGSLRSQVDAEVAERHQDSNIPGGSASDRLSDLLNPTAKGPQQSKQTHGKEMISEGMLDHTNQLILNPVGPPNEPDPPRGGSGRQILDDNFRVTSDDGKVRVYTDGKKVISGTDAIVTKYADGTTKVEKLGLGGNTTVVHPDGSTVTMEPGKEPEETPPLESYDRENYTGNIPDEVKKMMDYFKQQAISQKPQSGGETVHTDDTAAADTTTGGRVSNLVVQQGNLGLLGNPGSAQTGPATGGQGPVGSSQSGGNVDVGPDSDQVGYTGATHQEDPADVQFGPAEQPKQQTDARKSEDSDNSSSSILDPLHRKKRDI